MEKEQRRAYMEDTGFGKRVDPMTDMPSTVDFEFSFTSVETNPGPLTGAPADDIFSNGQILPVYPVFNQDLVAGGLDKSGEEKLAEAMGRLALPFDKRDRRSGSASSSTMSSDVEDLEDLRGSEAEYCTWTPISAPQSPDRWRKSSSTGSEAPEFRRFRIRDLVIGRSRSDGKEKRFHLPETDKQTRRCTLQPNPSHKSDAEAERKGKAGKEKGKERPVKELDVVTAHRVYYGKRAADGRRSFLPYRQVLLQGFFGHGSRNPF